MDRACSSGAPLPPNWEGAPSSYPWPPLLLSPALPPLLRLAVGGGLLRSWGFPLISCIRPLTKGVCACSGGAPPPLLRSGVCPPPLLPIPACCALGAHDARGVFPPPLPPGSGVPFLLLGHAMCWERTLLYRGVPPFLWAWPARRRRARSVPCPLLPSRGVHPLLLVLLARGVPLLLIGHVMRWERTLP